MSGMAADILLAVACVVVGLAVVAWGRRGSHARPAPARGVASLWGTLAAWTGVVMCASVVVQLLARGKAEGIGALVTVVLSVAGALFAFRGLTKRSIGRVLDREARKGAVGIGLIYVALLGVAALVLPVAAARWSRTVADLCRIAGASPTVESLSELRGDGGSLVALTEAWCHHEPAVARVVEASDARVREPDEHFRFYALTVDPARGPALAWARGSCPAASGVVRVDRVILHSRGADDRLVAEAKTVGWVTPKGAPIVSAVDPEKLHTKLQRSRWVPLSWLGLMTLGVLLLWRLMGHRGLEARRD